MTFHAMNASVAATALFLFACGSSFYTTSTSGSSSPAAPLDSDPRRNDKPDVSITSTGLRPQVLHVSAPVVGTFTNEDSVPHTLRTADLGFDRCAEMDESGTLLPGQSGSAGFNQRDAACTYSDVAQPDNKAFQGYVEIHAPD